LQGISPSQRKLEVESILSQGVLMQKRNFTLAISKEAHHKARLWAAQYDVSLSALVCAFFEGLNTNPDAHRAARSINQKADKSARPTPTPTNPPIYPPASKRDPTTAQNL
jgi:hypothetical protein